MGQVTKFDDVAWEMEGDFEICRIFYFFRAFTSEYKV